MDITLLADEESHRTVFTGYLKEYKKYYYHRGTNHLNIKSIIFSYILTTIVFLIIDLAWLGFIAKDLYRKYLGSFLAENVNWTAAIIFYLLYIVGISIFAIYPSVNKDSFVSAIVLGALFGFFAYATYDLTNLATLKDWPITIVFIDIIWGAILTSSVSLAGFYIVKFVK